MMAIIEHTFCLVKTEYKEFQTHLSRPTACGLPRRSWVHAVLAHLSFVSFKTVEFMFWISKILRIRTIK